MDSSSRITGFTYQACKELEWLVSDFVWSRALADDTGQVLGGKAHVPLARSLGRHVVPPLRPPLRPAAPIGQHAPLARPAALHGRGHALIATVQAAAPRGQETAFALSVVGKPMRSVVSNHRAPLRGQIVGVIYPTGARSARRVAGAEVRRARASPAAAASIGIEGRGRLSIARLVPRSGTSLLRPPLCGST